LQNRQLLGRRGPARAALCCLAAAIWAAAAIGAAQSQGLTVLPVSIDLPPGQMAAAMTVINQGDGETSFQVRSFAWRQPGGEDQLAATDELLASPPLGTIPPGGTQVVRLVLRRPAQAQEATYRILFDQIPPPAAPGTVRIALRLSIPVFAQPPTRVAPHLQWRIESSGRQASLVAVNDGSHHEAVRDIALSQTGGAAVKIESGASPYVLAGSTRRWRILSPGVPSPGASMHLTAHADAAPVDQPVAIVAGP
jgi:fimbrial chaperone protein